MVKSRILIVSPALAKANNGNWQTAARWSRFLRTRHHVTCLEWVDGLSQTLRPDLIIALHARRSAAALTEYADAFPNVPRVLVLTGTDVYRDIHVDAMARNSLTLATRLVVLQPAALDELAPAVRAKTEVIFQSAPRLQPIAATSVGKTTLRVTMIGHLRAEKDPLTYLRAAALLRDTPIRFTLVGAALDPVLGAAATASSCHWLGSQPHAATRQRLKRSHLLVVPSLMEGGANVIIEAITSGVSVLASAISGNRGMLGDDYAGYFPVEDSAALAALILRVAHDPVFETRLREQCAARLPLFTPQREQAAVLQLVDNCLHPDNPTGTT